MIKFHKPRFFVLTVDILMFIITAFVILQWFPLTTQNPFSKYALSALDYLIVWILISNLLGRYKPLHEQSYLVVTFKLVLVNLITFIVFFVTSELFFDGRFSEYVMITFVTIVFTVNIIFYNMYYALIYAVEYDVKSVLPDEKRRNTKCQLLPDIDDETFNELRESIISYSGKKVFDKLSEIINFKSGNTYVNFSSNYLDLKKTPKYKFSAMVNLEKLNNIRGINKLFAIANYRLPEDGLFICCFESKSTTKKTFFKKYPFGINYFMYSLDFLFKRYLPKVILTRRIFHDLTNGKNRVLSKPEVLGRIYYSGFELVFEKKIDNINYLFLKRIKDPEPIENKTYGMFIRLKRFGKNGKMFDVYKLRTMHPYSEYLQAFMYENNSLQAGGKFYRDIRITTTGRIMRKYWIDELPMLYNLVKGEMKIVGVRPLSSQYFGLYSKELQTKRIKFTPGLLPPFYADMPKTLDDIQNSEMKYLTECEKKGVFRTDFKYFFLILQSILIKKARSA